MAGKIRLAKDLGSSGVATGWAADPACGAVPASVEAAGI